MVIMDAYTRVSHVGTRDLDKLQSPEQQLDFILPYAETNGVTVGERFKELDWSGGVLDRPQFQAAIERIERGESAGMIVARLDRFSRDVRHIYAALERIERAGGKLIAVAENFDLSTAAGRLHFGMMAQFAGYQLDQIKEGWEHTHRRHVDAGIPTRVPFGYERGPDRRLVPNADALFVTDLFRRRLAGESKASIAKWLNDAHVRTAQGAHWQPGALRHVLANRAYLGEVRYGKLVNRGCHEPLIDEPTWQAVQGLRVPRRPRSRAGRENLVSGILRCAGCRYALQPAFTPKGEAYYRCVTKHAAGKCQCPTTVFAGRIESYVEAIVLEERERLLQAPEPVADTGEHDRLTLAAEHARANREAFMENLDALRLMGQARWNDQLAALERAVNEGEAALAALAVPAVERSRLVDYPDLSVVERRKVLAEAIDVIWIRGGFGRGAGTHRVPLDQRVLIQWAGSADRDMLPRSGKRDFAIVPFTFADAPVTAELPA